MDDFIYSYEVAKKAAVFFKEKDVDVFILNIGTLLMILGSSTTDRDRYSIYCLGS